MATLPGSTCPTLILSFESAPADANNNGLIASAGNVISTFGLSTVRLFPFFTISSKVAVSSIISCIALLVIFAVTLLESGSSICPASSLSPKVIASMAEEVDITEVVVAAETTVVVVVVSAVVDVPPPPPPPPPPSPLVVVSTVSDAVNAIVVMMPANVDPVAAYRTFNEILPDRSGKLPLYLIHEIPFVLYSIVVNIPVTVLVLSLPTTFVVDVLASISIICTVPAEVSDVPAYLILISFSAVIELISAEVKVWPAEFAAV